MLFESIKGTKRKVTPQLKVLEIVFVIIAILKFNKNQIKLKRKYDLKKQGVNFTIQKINFVYQIKNVSKN